MLYEYVRMKGGEAVARFRRLLAAALILALLTGCSGLSYEGLYSLPRASEAYYDLQNALNTVLESGYNYCAPASGARQEPVQLTDLDGDGVDEAVAFFRSADKGEVKAYIFSQADSVFTPSAVIDGAGSTVAAVEYADLLGNGSLEMIVTYQVSESVTQALQVYRYEAGQADSLLTAGCSRYELGDLDGDGRQELICLTDGGADTPGQISCYQGAEGKLNLAGDLLLQTPYDQLRKICWGSLEDGCAAVTLSGTAGDGTLYTEIFTLRDGNLTETTPPEGVAQNQPIHSSYFYPEDLDEDGFLEFPVTRALPAYDDGSAAQWVVDWYTLDSAGTADKEFTAYHNTSEGWYLLLLEPWNRDLTIKAGAESTSVSTVTLYRGIGSGAGEILTVYTLRGARRQTYAEEHGLTILRSDSETENMYAVSLAAAEPWAGTATMAEVSELFHMTTDKDIDR